MKVTLILYIRGRQRRSWNAVYRCPAEFRSNPEKTHLPVALVILKILISLFRCVWLGLELNSTGQRHSRTDVVYPCSTYSEAQMSGVNDDCYIHYYIHQLNTSTANRRHFVFPCTGVDTMMDWWQLTQGWSKVRHPCQSTIMGGTCTELRHSDKALRTAWFEILKHGFKKTTKHWVDIYHYRMDVYIHFQHTFMFKQLVKWILHPMTPSSKDHVPRR